MNSTKILPLGKQKLSQIWVYGLAIAPERYAARRRTNGYRPYNLGPHQLSSSAVGPQLHDSAMQNRLGGIGQRHAVIGQNGITN